MALKLQQIRTCDGQCCKDSPRFPNADKSDCVYRHTTKGKQNKGCMIMTGEVSVPDGESLMFIGESAASVFDRTCKKWPHETCTPILGKTGNCCWQWVNI